MLSKKQNTTSTRFITAVHVVLLAELLRSLQHENLIFIVFMLLYQIFCTGLQHQGRIFGCSCCIACELAKNQYLRNIRLEFCPPNPKAFVMAVSTVILRHSPRTKSRSESQSSRFKVGGTIPSRIAWIQAIASVMPPAPIMWPVAPFCRADGRAFEQLTKRIQLGFIP